MANTHDSMPRNIPPPDPIGVLGQLGILSKNRLESVRTKVETGGYPSAFTELIEKLVNEHVLTTFQGRMILAGRSNDIVLGRYILLRPLARGAMGKVFKAYHRMLGRVVALKLIASKEPSERAISGFRREMKLVGRLNHPNIAVAHDAGRCKGVFFIAMEYLSGQTLKDCLEERGPLPPDDVIRYAAQAAQGLAHAHAQGIVHRDVKPANIWLDKELRVKILDLGLGILMDETESVEAGDVGKLIGTAEYISPEQACQRPLDGRSDLYALGCTMYHLIKGLPPFSDRSWIEQLAIRVSGQHESIANELADEPQGLRSVMEKLLAHNPDDRFQTGDEAAEALLALVNSEVTATDPIPLPDQASQPVQEPIAVHSLLRRRLVQVARLAIAAVAVVVFVDFAYFLIDSRPRNPLPLETSKQAKRTVENMDSIPEPIESEISASASSIESKKPRLIEIDPPKPQPLRFEAPKVNWNLGLEQARLTSFVPRDLRFVPLAMSVRHPAFLAQMTDHGHEPSHAPLTFKERDESVPESEQPIQHDTVRAVEAWRIALSRRQKNSDAEVNRAASLPGPSTPVGAQQDPLSPTYPREPRPTTIRVFMPDEKAELVVRGAVGRGNPDEWYGPKRVIHTPPLDGSTDYIVGAFWTDAAGKPAVRQKEFKAKPGTLYEVDLRPVVPTFTEISK